MSDIHNNAAGHESQLMDQDAIVDKLDVEIKSESLPDLSNSIQETSSDKCHQKSTSDQLSDRWGSNGDTQQDNKAISCNQIESVKQEELLTTVSDDEDSSADDTISSSDSSSIQTFNCENESTISIESNKELDQVNKYPSLPIHTVKESSPIVLNGGDYYPEKLNPFEDYENEKDNDLPLSESTHETNAINSTNDASQYPETLNPFEDEDSQQSTLMNQSHISSSSLNPFESDDEDYHQEEPQCCTTKLDITESTIHSSNTSYPQPIPRKSLQKPLRSATSAPRDHGSASNSKSRLKKRPAPLPPSSKTDADCLNVNENSSNLSEQSSHEIHNPDLECTYDSIISNVSSNSSSSLAVSTSRTPTPTPRRSKLNTNSSSSQTNLDDSISNGSINAQITIIKNKKRPAPPIPAFKRAIKSSIAEIEQELNQIGEELPKVESKRNELEKWLLENKTVDLTNSQLNDPNDCNLSSQYAEALKEFLQLAKQRCRLAQKQKELMYTKRDHKLEETQAEIEYQLRVIVSKQDAQKDEVDKSQERELLSRLMEVIDERNDIIENMILEENKEIDEYLSLVSKVEPSENKEDPCQQVNTAKRHHVKHRAISLLKIKKKKNKKSKDFNETTKVTFQNDENVSHGNEDPAESSSTPCDNQLPSNIEISEDDKKDSKKKRKKHFTIGRTALEKINNAKNHLNLKNITFHQHPN